MPDIEKNYDENALIDAETTCIKEICQALGLRPGENGFLSTFPGLQDCVIFDLGYLQIGDQTAFPASSFCFRGSLELYNRSRDMLQKWIARLMGSFPVAPRHGRRPTPYSGGRVLVLRIAPESGSISKITTEDVQLHSGTSSSTFTASVAFDVVFHINPPETAETRNIGG